MDWTLVLTILGVNMAMFMWATRQARSDFLQSLESCLKIQHSLYCNKFIQLDKKLDENKHDLHGRLCAIEERTRTHCE